MPCGSFNNYARKVRDPGRPLNARRSTLCCCIQQYRGISQQSYPALRAYFTVRYHLDAPDDVRLLAALAALEITRNRILEARRAYDAKRLRQKARGMRQPRKADEEAYREAVRRIEAEAGFWS